MDPREKARVTATVGGATFLLSLLRGSSSEEARAHARDAVAAAEPLADELLPVLREALAARAAKAAAKKAQEAAPRCGPRAGLICVLKLRHPGEYHQDEHGTLFRDD